MTDNKQKQRIFHTVMREITPDMPAYNDEILDRVTARSILAPFFVDLENCRLQVESDSQQGRVVQILSLSGSAAHCCRSEQDEQHDHALRRFHCHDCSPSHHQLLQHHNTSVYIHDIFLFMLVWRVHHCLSTSLPVLPATQHSRRMQCGRRGRLFAELC